MKRAPAKLPPPPGVHAQKGYNPRVLLFHGLVAVLLLTLAGGLAWQQLMRADLYHERERTQSQRRILVPGPRGSIYDREGRLLAGSRPRFAVTLALDELHAEFRQEYFAIRKNYRARLDAEHPLPTVAQLEQIARFAVVQRYLDQVNLALGRHDPLDATALDHHLEQQPLLPYLLLNDLAPAEYARLLEQLPVSSPLQVYASSVRYYPYGALAAHTLGYISASDDTGPPEDFPGDGLTTFKLKGSVGRTGLEARFDDHLQGGSGGAIFRVSPAGYRINPPLEKRPPTPGRDLATSLDADLQAAAEAALDKLNLTGSAVALDVHTGEVLVLASAPGYNLQDFSPRVGQPTVNDINDRGAWFNRALNGLYPPGSTFKILTSIAALRAGAITPDAPIVDCQGRIEIAGHIFTCYNGRTEHGEILLRDAISQSCDIFFYEAGRLAKPEVLAREARRFQLDLPTGVELPGETRRALIPDPEWKARSTPNHESWFAGDTANMAIGQGFVRLTPLRMACFAASVARNEISTTPTLLHNPDAPAQHSEPIGLTSAQRAALLDGMEGCTTTGTAKILTTIAAARIPNLRIAGKTGTAQIPGRKNVAWFICFAPLENPQVAIAVAIEGDTAGEETSGGLYAAPVAQAILRKWNEKQAHAPAPLLFQLPGKPAPP